MDSFPVYPIGTPGTPWGDEEKNQWRARQSQQRDYFIEVASKVLRLEDGDAFQYGELDYRKYGSARFPLYAIKSSNWDNSRKMIAVTGGVHGYETSGVQGAILFAKNHLASTSKDINVLVLPCVSPWGYEQIQRWNPEAVDPNRQFNPKNPGCPEAAQAMKCIQDHVEQSAGIVMHTDLHETTDSDNSEFRPAKFARDAEPTPKYTEIPPGFYNVASTHSHEPAFQKAMIDAVAKITTISPPDADGCIIGEKITDHGVIAVDGRKWGICGAHTEARFAVTTEVYPDLAGCTDEECNRAQEACVVAGLAYALKNM